MSESDIPYAYDHCERLSVVGPFSFVIILRVVRNYAMDKLVKFGLVVNE